MTLPPVNSTPPKLYTAEQLGESFQITAWWIKDQARQRKIPFTKVGGQYRFTEQHAEAIICLFEQQPEQHLQSVPRRPSRTRGTDEPTQLRARTPRRKAS